MPLLTSHDQRRFNLTTYSVLSLFFLLTSIGVFMTPPAQASGFKSPSECLAYEGDAHLNCLYAYIELQKDKLTKFEDELSQVKSTTQSLQNQVTRQATVTEELRRGLERREQDYRYAPRYNLVPSLGLSFNFGRSHHRHRNFGYRRFSPRFFSPCFGSYYGPYGGCW